MRISTTNLETAGAFLVDIKRLARKHPELMHLLVQMKTKITRDVFVKSGGQLGLVASLWQAMRSVVASFRMRITSLVTSLMRSPGAHPHHHNHGAAHQKAMHYHRNAFRNVSRPNHRNVRRRDKTSGIFTADIEQFEDALWMVRDLAESFPDGLPPDDLELLLNRWIPWDQYSLAQQALLQKAVHRVLADAAKNK